MDLTSLIKELKSLEDIDKANIFSRFFKSGPGEYGEGDQFLGLSVPTSRKLVAKYYRNLELPDLDKLLSNPYHEARLIALLVLVKKYQTTKSDSEKRKYYDYYLSHTKQINNWDLVDVTTPQIVGDYLLTHDREILYKLARSHNIWERRISIMATFAFLRAGNYIHNVKLSKILSNDQHDLMHKAVGWMLRDIGNKDTAILTNYLDQHAGVMPRTMLRYSIEKLTEVERQYYLKQKS